MGQQAERAFIPQLRDSGIISPDGLARTWAGQLLAFWCRISRDLGAHVHRELSLALQEVGIGLDELLRIDVLDGNTTHFVGLV